MIEKEGTGSSCGVNYAYILSTNGTWFGRYECRVHRYFLDCPFVELCTKNFVIGGCTWQLRLKHMGDGNLGMYLVSQNQVSVAADCCFAVSNYAGAGENKWRVGQYENLPGGFTAQGCSDIISIAQLKDRSSGFLNGDCFAVKLELRYRSPENQKLAVSSSTACTTCTWKLKSPGACGLRIRSDPFDVGEWKGELEIHKSVSIDREQYENFAVYFRSNLLREMKASVTAINQFPGMNRTAELKLDRGPKRMYSSAILNARELKDEAFGFLKNGWITFVAEISIEDQFELPHLQTRLTTEASKSNKTPKCAFCLDEIQTAGVLHGNTTHKCYCTDCARFLNQEQCNMNCPICGEKVDVIIEKMF